MLNHQDAIVHIRESVQNDQTLHIQKEEREFRIFEDLDRKLKDLESKIGRSHEVRRI
jgi:hypothetical protein